MDRDGVAIGGERLDERTADAACAASDQRGARDG
jgi:hypothetical protein